MVFEPAATCVLPASCMILAQRFNSRACAARISSSSTVAHFRATLGCLIISCGPGRRSRCSRLGLVLSDSREEAGKVRIEGTYPCLFHRLYSCLISSAYFDRIRRTEQMLKHHSRDTLTLGFCSLTNNAHARVACPACAAIFPFDILRLSFTTNTSLISCIAVAFIEAILLRIASDSSSASDSVSVAPSLTVSGDDAGDDGREREFAPDAAADEEVWSVPVVPGTDGPVKGAREDDKRD
jgi:hypothetical protein